MVHATSTSRAPGPDQGLAQSEWENVSGVFRSLGSPLRIGIVVLLNERSRSVNELVEALRVSQPLVSQHLRVLRSSGMVRGTRHGREMIYAVSDAAVYDLVTKASRQLRPQRKSLRVAG